MVDIRISWRIGQQISVASQMRLLILRLGEDVKNSHVLFLLSASFDNSIIENVKPLKRLK
ncbi:hypothetical protein ACX0G7_16515 [Flavitalea antarctica]